ncbi:MAG: hypothetical protein R2724_01850 [Bryobacterales bacterium]
MLNASLLGLTRPEVTAKFDAIVDFSELERFLDEPLRTYSSGMVARLGFAIAIHVDPEILVLDEVLAVGDARFQPSASSAWDRWQPAAQRCSSSRTRWRS